jgi:hypothetical protein
LQHLDSHKRKGREGKGKEGKGRKKLSLNNALVWSGIMYCVSYLYLGISMEYS